MSTINGKSQIQLEAEANMARKAMADYTSAQQHPEADLSIAPPCPLCKSTNLGTDVWCDDTGEYDAIECNDCLCAAPVSAWMNRQAYCDEIIIEVDGKKVIAK